MQTSKVLAPNLLSIIDKIELNSKSISSYWLRLDAVHQVFKNHKISLRKFQTGYGIPIIEYFIAVVREEKEAGDCPIMSKLVHYLLKKGITPKDVFDICMGLRRSLISYIFKNSLVSDKQTQMMEELATLFDANLSGVLEIFTGFYEEKQLQVTKTIQKYKKFNETLKIINFINTKIIIVQSGQINMGNKAFFEMIGVQNLQECYQKGYQNLSFLENLDISKEPTPTEIENFLQDMSQSKKTFKADIYHHQHHLRYTYSIRITSLPDTQPIKYIISLNNISNYLEEKESVKKTLEEDPLTGLYNYMKFENLAKQAANDILETNGSLGLIVISLPFLEQITQEHGLEAVDSAIINTASLVKSFADESMLLSRFSDNKIAILAPFKVEQELYDSCCKLYTELTKQQYKKRISLTAIRDGESFNNALIRALNFTDAVDVENEKVVYTDFDNIDFIEDYPDQDKFIATLKGEKEVKTILYYKGLAIPTQSKIGHIAQNRLLIHLTPKEFSIVFTDKPIYVDLPSIGIVKALIYAVNEKNMTITLHKFRLDSTSPLKRKTIRVHTQEDTPLSVLFNGVIMEGTIVDVNERYIAAYFQRKRNLREGNSVTIDTLLKAKESEYTLSSDAIVHKIYKLQDMYKVVYLCHLKKENKNILEQYIAARQMEIIHELKEKSLTDK